MSAQQQRSKRNHSKRKLQTMLQRISRMEDEVYQAMAVVNASTDKMLNYRQLRRNPKYKIQWDITLQQTTFQGLADELGNRIKGANIIGFI